MDAKDTTTDSDDLRSAIAWEYPSVAIRLLRADPALVNARFADRSMPLHIAANQWFNRSKRDPKLEVLRYLLEHGAEVNVRDKEGRTPLYLAKSWYDVSGMRLLIEHGADVNAADVKDQTPLHIRGATSSTAPRAVRAVRLLLQHGANPNAKDHHNRTPLHTVEAGLPALKLLVSHGAELEPVDEDGRTPLHYAAKRQSEEVAFLIEQGARLNIQDREGLSPLHLTVSGGFGGDCAQPLLDAGAATNIRNCQGMTPLHLAAMYNCLDGARRLVAAGADPKAEAMLHGTLLNIIRNGPHPEFDEFYRPGTPQYKEDLREFARLLKNAGRR
jgi:ankyrin repeat protein